MTIPTIPDILDGVATGAYTVQEAAVWIELHIGEEVESAFELDQCAVQAMQALMGNAKFLQDAKNAAQDVREAVAVEAYATARAMKTQRMI